MNDTPKTDTPTPQTVTEQTLQRLGIQWGTSEWIRVCNKLESELTAVTEQRDGLKQAVDCANDLLASVTEQRDELLRYNEAFRNETLICADCDSIRKEEYDQAIEQRDRLAEALKIDPYPDEPISDDLHGGNVYCEISVGEMRKIREALQSLTTNAPTSEKL